MEEKEENGRGFGLKESVFKGEGSKISTSNSKVFVLLIVATPRDGSYVFKALRNCCHITPYSCTSMGVNGFIAWKNAWLLVSPHSPSSLAEWAGLMGWIFPFFYVYFKFGLGLVGLR